MAKTPKSVEIRAYQVGFGDCFLMSFVYSNTDKRHLLIDFGTTGLPKNLVPSKHMPAVAEAIREQCGGTLTAVVATHRHADHISGFATDSRSGQSGDIIAECKPAVVLQPWTEDPKAAKNATHATANTRRSMRSFVAGLAAMHHIAEAAAAIADKPPHTMSAATAKQLRFLGMDNIANKSAVENLIGMGKKGKAVFARHGSKSGLEKLLPGVKVHVLGPPDLTQSEKIKKMKSSDPDEFWQLIGGSNTLRGLSNRNRGSNGKPMPAEARWFSQRIATMSHEQLLEIVRVLDDQLNNTSLILLFEVGDKRLLFPGDAQIENWSYALEDAPNAEKVRELLADVDFYKVGHHGSRNATPKQLLWETFSKRGSAKGRRLKTLLSTMPGKHGHTERKTEVPRKTLLTVLQNESDLLNTNKLKKAELFQLVTVKV